MTAKSNPRRHLGKRPTLPVQTLDKLQARLISARATGMHWRQIAEFFPGVPAGTLCAISKGRDPKSPAIRHALGLPEYAPAPVCAVHGVVHVGQCPKVKPTLPVWVTAGADWLAGRELAIAPANRKAYTVVAGRNAKAAGVSSSHRPLTSTWFAPRVADNNSTIDSPAAQIPVLEPCAVLRSWMVVE